MKLNRSWLPLGLSTLMMVEVALAADLTLPHSFSNGQIADANAVNANFQALTDSLNGLSGNTVQGSALHPVAFSGNYQELLQRPANFDDADADPNNELQTLSQVLNHGNDAAGGNLSNLGELSVGIVSPDPSAAVEISSISRGFLPPRMTFAQRNAIAIPAEGLVIYCTDGGGSGELQYFDGGRWKNLAGAPASAPTAETQDVASQFSTTNGTGGSQQGQSFTIGTQGGYLTRIVTNAIGGTTGTQLTNGVNSSSLLVREYINDLETGTPNAFSGNVLATFIGSPTILDNAYGTSYPSVEFKFDGNLYLEANTKYVVEIVAGSGVGVYCITSDVYADGQAYDIDGINLGFSRDFPISIYIKLD